MQKNEELKEESSQSSDHIKERFGILYQTLCEVQKGLMDSTAKIAGFYLIVIGWLATSESARKFIMLNESSKWLSIGALIGTFILYTNASFGAFLVSQRTMRLLNDLDYMPQDYLELRQINRSALIIFIAGVLLLSVHTGGLVWLIAS